MSVMLQLHVGNAGCLFNVMKVHVLTGVIDFARKVVFIDLTSYCAKFVT
jgi:hypothetical protein